MVPDLVWDGLRVGAVATLFGLVYLLFTEPDTGLRLLWGLAIPSLPALMVLAPGLWRQVCPLAFANQLPRRLRLSFGRRLPAGLEARAFTIALFLFVFAISMRAPFLNHSGWLTGAMLLAAPAAALVGGVLFKGRSGWCGTFCPLGPIQRAYGQAPVLEVTQTHCKPCVGCQKNCYDFAPKAAVFDDMYDENPRYAGERRLFAGMLPGLLIGYFLVQYQPDAGYFLYVVEILGAALVSVGVYHCSTSFMPLNPYRAAAGFAALALTIFYAFSGPIVLGTVFDLLHAGIPPEWAQWSSRTFGVVCGGTLLVSGLVNERRYRAAWTAARDAAATQTRRTHRVLVEDKSRSLSAENNQTLLSLLSKAACGVEGVCEAGQCGSDPVEILAGLENLTPLDETERATLSRLGAGPTIRLACCARVRGSVTLRALPESLNGAARPQTTLGDTAPEHAEPGATRMRAVALRGRKYMRRVLVIGNGIAGETVAEELYKARAGLHITLLSGERHPAYNRISIGLVAAGKSTPEALALRPEGWHTRRGIGLRLGLDALAIDREERSVTLSDGQVLTYDKLVLATGSRARVPVPQFLERDNAFVLQTLDDAVHLQRFIAIRAPRTAIVTGGGILAVETAENLARAGIETTLLCTSSRLMAKSIDAQSATVLKHYLEHIGVRVETEARISEWRGTSTFEAVRCADAWLQADCFVACIGTQRNVELARDCGLEVRQGIVVDDTMATSDADIYAVGDVAERQNRTAGLWSTAVAGGQTAAATILGTPADYMPVDVGVKLKSAGMDLRFFGSLEEQPGDEVLSAPPFEPAWWRVVVRDGRLVGAVLAGAPGTASEIWPLVENSIVTDAQVAALRTVLFAARGAEQAA